MKTKLLLLLAVAITAALISQPMFANVIYTYNGTPFTTVTGPYTTSDKVTGSLELMSALGPNMSPTSVTPLSFSFSDGVQTITNSSVGLFVNISFGTGPTGAITQWAVQVGTASGIIQTVNSITAFDSGHLVPLENGSGLVVFAHNPGIWSMSTSSVPDVGSTLGLLLPTVIALGVAAWQLTRAAV